MTPFHISLGYADDKMRTTLHQDLIFHPIQYTRVARCHLEKEGDLINSLCPNIPIFRYGFKLDSNNFFSLRVRKIERIFMLPSSYIQSWAFFNLNTTAEDMFVE
jgi:hypothetical protein